MSFSKILLLFLFCLHQCIFGANIIAHPVDNLFNIEIDLEANSLKITIESTPKLLNQHVNLGQKQGKLSKAQYTQLWAPIETLFTTNMRFTLDDVALKPELKNFLFLPIYNDLPTLSTQQDFAADESIDITRRNAVCLFICKLPSSQRPKQLSIKWQLYPKKKITDVLDVSATLYGYDDAEFAYFNPKEPEYIWHIPLKAVSPLKHRAQKNRQPASKTNSLLFYVQLIGILTMAIALFFLQKKWRIIPGLIIIGILTDSGFTTRVLNKEKQAHTESAKPIELFIQHHDNIYHAFKFRKETELYDVLAQSLDAKILDKLYGEIYNSLIIREEQGAVCLIERIERISTELLPTSNVKNGHFQVKSHWRVYGVVRHWGHAHKRTNEYQAVYTLSKKDGQWKITACDIKSQKRIE